MSIRELTLTSVVECLFAMGLERLQALAKLQPVEGPDGTLGYSIPIGDDTAFIDQVSLNNVILAFVKAKTLLSKEDKLANSGRANPDDDDPVLSGFGEGTSIGKKLVAAPLSERPAMLEKVLSVCGQITGDHVAIFGITALLGVLYYMGIKSMIKHPTQPLTDRPLQFFMGNLVGG